MKRNLTMKNEGMKGTTQQNMERRPHALLTETGNGAKSREADDCQIVRLANTNRQLLARMNTDYYCTRMITINIFVCSRSGRGDNVRETSRGRRVQGGTQTNIKAEQR